MNNKKLSLAILSLAVLASIACIASVSAGTATGVSNCWVGVTESDHSGQVPLNTWVYVYFDGVSPTGASVDVTVCDPAGNTILTQADVTTSGDVTFKAEIPGTYCVSLNGYPSYHDETTFVAGASLIVLPEGILGTLLGVVSAVGAVAVFGVVKKRKTN